MTVPVLSNSAEVFRPHAEEDHVSDREIVKFPGPLFSANKDQLMRFIQAKQLDCLCHLDNPDHQKSFFFWSVMELILNKNGKVTMPEIGTFLFKGYGLLRRKLGRVVNREDWCLPLAELLCSTAPRNQLRDEMIKMGDDFASRGWFYVAQICCVIAGMELGARPHFKVIGCESWPLGDLAAMTEVMERTMVFEHVVSLISGCGQPFFQEIKLFFACKLADDGQSALALDYCENIFEEILKFPDAPELCLLEKLLTLGEVLLQEKREEPKWVNKLRWMIQDFMGPLKFHHSQRTELDTRFNIGELLGQGGFGSVFAGVCKADGNEVAIKCAAKHPNDRFITVPGEMRSLPVEVALLQMVSKPPRSEHVIQMLEWFETPTHFILVLERPNPCMDLDTFCEDNNGHLPETVAKKIMRQVVEAACHCCDRGVFHRDIKPENILINPHTLDIKLIDFGCGDLLKDGWFEEFAGTEGFMPFEWVHWNKYHGVPATIWSLGVVLFELVCGNSPFNSREEIVGADLRFRLGLSVECCDLIAHCLERDPKYRAKFQDILDHKWFKQ